MNGGRDVALGWAILTLLISPGICPNPGILPGQSMQIEESAVPIHQGSQHHRVATFPADVAG